MSYPVFPSIKTPSGITPQFEDIGTTTKMSDGFEVSRARFTKSRLTFCVDFKALPVADKEAIDDFYLNVIRGSSQKFEWTYSDPKSQYYGKTFVVRMVQPPEASQVGPEHWAVRLTLREA